MDLEEKTIHSHRIFSGKFIDLRIDEVLLPNGKTSTREIVEHPGAVAVVALNKQNEVLMVRQYRKAVEKELLEIPAGKLEIGESKETCAKRELMEETGFYPKDLRYITSFYTTPGFTDEKMHLFLARDLQKNPKEADEDEFIKIEVISFNEVVKKVYNGEISDGKTIIGILLAYSLTKGEN